MNFRHLLLSLSTLEVRTFSQLLPPFAYILYCRKQRKSNCCLEAPLLNLAYLETGSFMALMQFAELGNQAETS